MVRDDGLLKFAGEDEGVHVLKVSLLHTSLRKRIKEIAKDMVDCTDANAKLRCYSQGPLRHIGALLELLYACIDVLF